MKLEEAKKYLRVDTDTQDDFISNLISVADDYMLSAIDNYKEKEKNENFKKKANICKLALIQDMFDNRIFINKDTDLSYTVRSMITQLQYTPKRSD